MGGTPDAASRPLAETQGRPIASRDPREVEQMNARRLLEIGGILAGALLIAIGVGALYIGVDAHNTTRDSLKQENITFGTADDPAVAEHAEQWAGEQVTTGDQARAFALIMREHALEASGGLTYAEMGRFVSADDPEDPAGTSDEELALKDDQGNPVANGARNTWVTETALSTALNVSFMAERLSLFSIAVGISLVLTGIGFVILALAVLGGVFHEKEETKPATVVAGATPAA
jgi:hypothetical protein